MEDPSHLEKMGRELKCPICLSLLNSAVSLTCNHIFCNSCIMKSMKSGSSCPVCKVPYRRREVRAAPHMDNLVSIYKSMEVASGFNILVTQNAPSTKLSDVEGEANCVEEDIDRVCEDSLQSQPILKQRGRRKSANSGKEISCPTVAKPSFPTNKRVQVPQYSLSQSSVQPEGENMKDGFEKSSVDLKENHGPAEKGKLVLSPFFWLRDEDVERLSQFTDGDQLLDITPPNHPTFSDIKDSDDELASKSSMSGGVCGKSIVVNVSDSEMFECTQRPCSPDEMFECTQRPCSPEPFSSPVNIQDANTNKNDGIRESNSEALSFSETANEEPNTEKGKIINPKQVMCISEGLLPHLSSSTAKSTKNQIGLNEFRRRARHPRKSTLKQCPKGNTDKAPVCSKTESGETMQNEAFDSKESSLNLGKTSKRSKKAGVCNSKTESNRETLGDEGGVAELLTSSGKKQGGDEDLKLKKTRRVCRKVSPGQANCPSRVKKQKLDSAGINMIGEVYATKNQIGEDASPQHSVPVVDNKNISDVKEKPHANGKDIGSALSLGCNRELRCKKNMKVSFFGLSEDRLADEDREDHSNDSAKHTQSTEKVTNIFGKETESSGKVQGSVNTRILDNSATRTNGATLRKCNILSCKIKCAFCLKSEDSEALGEMVHYCNGRPVAVDYTGGSKVIHSHRICAEWAPNVYFKDDSAINLEAELARSRRIKCCCCGLKGAALGCYENSCRRSFHLPCAKLIPQCRWDTENFVMLCSIHISSKLPNENLACQERRKKCIPKGQTAKQCNQAVLKSDVSTRQSWKSCVTPDKLVLCCSSLTIGERDFVCEFERLSGVRVLKNWDLSVTHVIASIDENGVCKRTLKFLMGILEGKWILSIEWVKACMNAMKIVEEEAYEIKIDAHGIRGGPRLGRLRIMNKQPKIFKGFKFYFMGDYLPSYKGYIQDLLIAGGGTILHRKPISGDDEAVLLNSLPTTFIIYSLEVHDKCDPSKKSIILNQRRSDAEALASSTGAKAVSNSWVLNSIAAYKFQSFVE